MKEPCRNCNGDGNVGIVEHNNRNYKILCPKCLGIKELDWIQQTSCIIKQRDALIISIFLDKNVVPDNYVFLYGGTAYFINKEFFDQSIVCYGAKRSSKWNHFRMNVPIVKTLPHLVKAWENEKQMWEEISFI